jgi:Protein of unknown function (DUF2752)
MTRNSNNTFLTLRLLFWVAVPVILLVLPPDFFDEDGIVMCPSRLLFGIECLGCGMTRASMHLIHFDVESALFYNGLSLIVTPLLAFFWAKWAWSDYQLWANRSKT